MKALISTKGALAMALTLLRSAAGQLYFAPATFEKRATANEKMTIYLLFIGILRENRKFSGNFSYRELSRLFR